MDTRTTHLVLHTAERPYFVAVNKSKDDNDNNASSTRVVVSSVQYSVRSLPLLSDDGIVNQGNNCYMISVVQILNSIPEYKLFIHEYNVQQASVKNNNVKRASNIISKMKEMLPLEGRVAPKYTSAACNLIMTNGRQHDVDEALNNIFNPAKGSSFPNIPSCMMTTIKTSFSCVDTDGVESKIPDYEPKNENMSIIYLEKNITGMGSFDLESIFSSSKEKMTGENNPSLTKADGTILRCPAESTYLKTIEYVPQRYLMIFLKRNTYTANKDHAPVDIKEELKNGESTFNLHGLIFHIGETSNSGHYTAMLRDYEGGGYRYYNDETVESHPVIPTDIRTSSSATFFIYRRM